MRRSGYLSGGESDFFIPGIENGQRHAVHRVDGGDHRANLEGRIIGLGIQTQTRVVSAAGSSPTIEVEVGGLSVLVEAITKDERQDCRPCEL